MGKCRGKTLLGAVEIPVGHFLLQTIAAVHPIRIVIVHPVQNHVVDLPRQEFSQALRFREHGSDHGEGADPGAM